ncbi:DNA gyrase subunit A [Clostridia bacterium]|nr:DNA gyrase subunit A [Clostridia bacterium]
MFDGHPNENLLYVDLQREMRQSFIEYSMSVIVARALPDVRDGLKPVHRRILYTKFEKGLTHDKPYHKCADTVGNVLGSYHPHGDASVYDALVRLAQSFSLRYPLVDGHGNFGSIDGDPPAAYRYTESRLARITGTLLADINKDTVDYGANYDDRLTEPLVLPAAFPNLLVNGSVGIAVGMATNIPPHNMGEAIDACLLLMREPTCGDDALIATLNAPDFPTGGIIMGRAGIFAAYKTGRGKITLRGRAEIEYGNKPRIVISEIPYMVKKSDIHIQIDELRTSKKVEGISVVRDESDRTGMRLVVELKAGVNADVVFNHICGYTQFQVTVGLILLALVDGVPRVLTLRQILEQFVSFREEVITRRTRFDLSKALARAHILQGLMLAVDNIDEVIRILRASRDVTEGKAALRERFSDFDLANLLTRAMLSACETSEACRDAMAAATVTAASAAVNVRVGGIGSIFSDVPNGLTEEQAESIVQMRFGQLTGLERDKIAVELAGLMAKIAEYRAILASHDRRVEIITEELLDIKKRYSDPRRTTVEDIDGEVIIEDLIPRSDIIVTLTDIGYIKRQDALEFTSQSRGGRGVSGMKQRDEDFVTDMLVSNTHHNILFMSDMGHMFALKGYDLPSGGRGSRGATLAGMLKLEDGENISVMMSSEDYGADKYIVGVTKNGFVKRTRLSEFAKIRKGAPLKSMGVDGGDTIVTAFIADSDMHILIATRAGKAIRFPVNRVRASGRTAHGVRGIRLSGGDYVVGASGIPCDNAADTGNATDGTADNISLLTVTDKGIGKRTAVGEYPAKGRGGKGNFNYRPNEKRGYVIGVRVIKDGDDVLMINDKGIIIRFKAEDIRLMGRTAGGVRLMRLADDGRVVAFARAERDEEAEAEVVDADDVVEVEPGEVAEDDGDDGDSGDDDGDDSGSGDSEDNVN